MRRRPSVAFSLSQILRNVLIALTIMAVLWWFLADRPMPFGGASAPVRALREYIDAARQHDCAAVVQRLSARSRELAATRAADRLFVERMFCDYSPATAKLPDFETDRIRVERVAGSTARVSASYTYDRFFGFFGRGRDRYTYSLILEDGRYALRDPRTRRRVRQSSIRQRHPRHGEDSSAWHTIDVSIQ